MNESLLNPNTCRFAKVAAIFSSKEAQKKLKSNKGHKGNSAFWNYVSNILRMFLKAEKMFIM